jgi:hypothetical protein
VYNLLGLRLCFDFGFLQACVTLTNDSFDLAKLPSAQELY